MIDSEKKLTLDNGIAYIGIVIMSLFSLNPIIQFIYSRATNTLCGGWFTIREYYNYIVLLVGIILFTYYIIYRWMNNNNVGIFKTQWKNPAFILFILFAMCMAVSTLINKAYVNFSVALIGNTYRNEGLLTYLSYLIYFLFAAFITDEKIKMIWMKAFAVVSSVPALLIIIDYVFPSLELETMYIGNRAAANYSTVLFNNPNHTAYYVLISVSVAAVLFVKSKKGYEHILFGALTLAGAAALIINDTLGCMLAYIAMSILAVIVISVSERKFSFKSLAPIGFFILALVILILTSSEIRSLLGLDKKAVADIGDTVESIVTEGDLNEEIVSDNAGSGRIKLWRTAIELIKARPWLGYSSDGIAYKLEYECNNDRCHCEYMNYALSFGIPAAVLYFAAIFTVYLRGLKYSKKLTDTNKIGLIAAFGYCVSAVVGNSMFYTAPLMFIMLGMGYYRKKQY